MLEFYEEEREDEFYSEDRMEALIEDDEISPAEEGFMMGYLEAET